MTVEKAGDTVNSDPLCNASSRKWLNKFVVTKDSHKSLKLAATLLWHIKTDSETQFDLNLLHALHSHLDRCDNNYILSQTDYNTNLMQ